MKKLMVALCACVCALGMFVGNDALAGFLPPEYQEVEYVQSSGSQYIDTGVVINENHELQFKYAMLAISAYKGPFGTYQSETHNATRVTANNGSKTALLVNFMTKASGGGTVFNGVTTAAGDIVEGYMNYNRARFNNVEQNLNHTTFGTADPSTLKLLGRASYSTSIRLYYFRILENGELTHDYVPCYQRSDETQIGFYDLIGNEFYAVSGLAKGENVYREFVYVSGAPANFAVGGEPVYGLNVATNGQEFAFAAPDDAVMTSTGTVAVCTGWKLYDANTLDLICESDENNKLFCSLTYESPVNLDWQWEVRAIGAEDDIVINREVLARSPLACKSLTVKEGGKLRVFASGSEDLSIDAQSLVIDPGAVAVFGGTSFTLAGLKAQMPDAANLPATISLNFSGSITNAGLLSIGTRNCTNKLSVAVGGDFVMADGSSTAVYAGRADNALDYNSLYSKASTVAVARKLALLGNAVLYSENDAVSGNPVRYTASEFAVDRGATVDMVSRGYEYVLNTTANLPADIPTCVYNSKTYCSYGPGRTGSGAYVVAGHSYGYRLAPFLPGSPAIYGGPCRGSGSIVVEAGRIRVDGTITAYGGTISAHSQPSAGEIMLFADDFDVGIDALITAEGCHNTQFNNSIAVPGRVALLCGFTADDLATLVAGGEPDGVNVCDASQYPMGDINALAGTTKDGGRGSSSGTTCFARPGALQKRLLSVNCAVDGAVDAPAVPSVRAIRDADAAWTVGGAAVADGFRARTFAYGTAVTLSMDTADVPVESVAYGFRGWQLARASNPDEVVRFGAESSVTIDVDDDYVLTWLWRQSAYTMTASAGEGGQITYGGTSYAPGSDCSFAVDCGATSGELTAVADAGHEFLYWAGDIEPAKARAAAITLTATQARRLTAVFRPAAAPKAREFRATAANASGSWLDPARWTDGVIPGLEDPVTIAVGTCKVANYLDAKSVTVANGANLLVADEGTEGGYVRDITAKLTDGDLVVEKGAVAAIGGTLVTAAGVKAQKFDSAHLPARVSLAVAGSVSNAGGLSVGATGGLGVTNTLDVAITGDLVLAAGSVTAIYAGAASDPMNLPSLWTEASRVTASRISVQGAADSVAGAILYPENNAFYGTPVKFVAGDFIVGAGAQVDTTGRGYQYYAPAADQRTQLYPADMPYFESGGLAYLSYGPGATSAGAYVTAGHGANGSVGKPSPSNRQSYGTGYAYGYRFAPFLAGSPSIYGGINRGAGSIVVVADRMRIDGKLSVYGGQYSSHSTPSPGGIMLVSDDIVFGADAVLTAEGSYNTQFTNTNGAGGRIGILSGFDDETLDLLTTGEESLDVVVCDASDYEIASIDALSGKHKNGLRGTNNGTTCFVRPAEAVPRLIAVRSNRGDAGRTDLTLNGESVDYGSRTVADGTSLTFVQNDTSASIVDGKVMSMAGYEVYDLADPSTPIASGTGNHVTLTADGDRLLVWKYDVTGLVMKVPSNANGSIRYTDLEGNVTVASGGDVCEIPVRTGEPETGDILAVPAAGYEFLCWEGDVEFGKSALNPVRLSGNVVRTIRPVFRETQVLSEPRVFSAGGAKKRGYWTDPASWTPAGIPGPNDDVVINAGECVASNYVAARSITVNTDGKLKVGGYGKAIGDAVNAGERSGEMDPSIASAFLPIENELLHDVRVVVSGSVTLNGNGQFGVGGITPHQRWQDVSIGGDLTLNGTSVLLVSGGETNQTVNYETGAAWLKVGGTFALNDTSRFVPQSERYTGGSVKVVCRRFVVAEGALVDALRRGFGQYQLREVSTLAPGASTTPGAITAGLYNYGYEYAPIHPGSPRGTYNLAYSSGGGLIRVHAETMEIAGTLDASCGDPTGTDYGHGSASGGGIWLTSAKQIEFAGTPSLLAGGYKTKYGDGTMGTGGRIAITHSPDQGVIDQLAHTGTNPRVVRKAIGLVAFTNEFQNVTVNIDRSVDGSCAVKPGTFHYVPVPHGLMIMIR